MGTSAIKTLETLEMQYVGMVLKPKLKSATMVISICLMDAIIAIMNVYWIAEIASEGDAYTAKMVFTWTSFLIAVSQYVEMVC